MAEPDFLAECKKSLNLSVDSKDMDDFLNQKITIVKSFLKGAGVSDETLVTEDAIGVITIGVSDLWELKAGEVKFSSAFHILATQLAVG
ncbi:phage gp6-like head-tail connector protein [Gracilibacillus saliphilus]|uniref:phage gp6-like head-tail connector protein n=1 Tax=Gracilibacillus saliphilus TaxID=543890 RepID=UPI0013D8BD73|nr:phage gp6-like head-tail connector protein [Gracilibacillus saliphilus]